MSSTTPSKVVWYCLSRQRGRVEIHSKGSPFKQRIRSYIHHICSNSTGGNSVTPSCKQDRDMASPSGYTFLYPGGREDGLGYGTNSKRKGLKTFLKSSFISMIVVKYRHTSHDIKLPLHYSTMSFFRQGLI